MFQVSINLDNAAFDNPDELPQLLENIAKQIRDGKLEAVVVDSNGNRVGKWQIVSSDE